MARPESIALGGYFPTPRHLLPSLASLVGFELPASSDRHVLVDPCTGDGEAICTLRDLWFGTTRTPSRSASLDAHIFAVELERERFNAARRRLNHWDQASNHNWDVVLEADAFQVGIERRDGASILFLNPPYDTDPVQWEDRAAVPEAVGPVPHARRRAADAPRSPLCARCLRHVPRLQLLELSRLAVPRRGFLTIQAVRPGRSPASVRPAGQRRGSPEDREVGRVGRQLAHSRKALLPAFLISGERPGLNLARLTLDVEGLLDGFRPWVNSPVFGTHRSVDELIGSPFQVAMPPRPAHIALALAAVRSTASVSCPTARACRLCSSRGRCAATS